MEIRVAVEDASRAHALMRHLMGLFDRPSVSFDRARSEVRVRSEWGSRAVVEVIGTVESWLATADVESATLSVGDRSYTMVAPESTAPRGRAA